MTDLFIFNQKIDSIFDLLGEKENDISYAVGYAFSTSDRFLKLLLKEVGIAENLFDNNAKIKLQQHETGKGFTDFEIVQEDKFHLIIEAKRGWVFPGESQLEKYASRLSFNHSENLERKIIVFNESTPSYTEAHFMPILKGGLSVQVLSWKKLGELARIAMASKDRNEKNILRQLIVYLDRVSTMQKNDSNWAYVVSLGSNTPDNWLISWQGIVNDRKKYFHPVGGGKGGWPKEPPNYIAFRYNGRLQSIHHINRYELFIDPNKHFPEIPADLWSTHYLYHLGEAIKPVKEVRTGKQIPRSMRVWAMIDLLLTSSTIGEARDLSRKRGLSNDLED